MLHNKAVHNLYRPTCWIAKSRRLQRAQIGKMKNAHTIWAGKPLEKWQHGRPRRKLEDNIKMDHRERDITMESAWNGLITVSTAGIWYQLC
jgi:hypothetical protein